MVGDSGKVVHNAINHRLITVQVTETAQQITGKLWLTDSHTKNAAQETYRCVVDKSEGSITVYDVIKAIVRHCGKDTDASFSMHDYGRIDQLMTSQ